jgi:hypothetical protein
MKLINDSTKNKSNYANTLQKNDIIALKKHVDANHVMLAKRFEEGVNSPLRDVLEKQPTIKRPNVSNSEISEFFWCIRFFLKICCAMKASFARPCPFGC